MKIIIELLCSNVAKKCKQPKKVLRNLYEVWLLSCVSSLHPFCVLFSDALIKFKGILPDVSCANKCPRYTDTVSLHRVKLCKGSTWWQTV